MSIVRDHAIRAYTLAEARGKRREEYLWGWTISGMGKILNLVQRAKPEPAPACPFFQVRAIN